jgi:hypothetical protein
MVNFTPLPLYPRGKSPRYPLGLSWGLEPIWTLWSRDKYLAPAGNRTPTVQPVAIPTELSRLLMTNLIPEKNSSDDYCVGFLFWLNIALPKFLYGKADIHDAKAICRVEDLVFFDEFDVKSLPTLEGVSSLWILDERLRNG